MALILCGDLPLSRQSHLSCWYPCIFCARDFPIVGTTLDYLDFRNLIMAEGRPFSLLGGCVVGHAVAGKLGLKPGDSLVYDPCANIPDREDFMGVMRANIENLKMAF